MFPLPKSPNVLPRKSARLTAAQHRERIASITLQMILDCGTNELSIAKICLAAGVSRATLYRHYSGIKEILEGVFDLTIKRFSDDLRAAIDASPDIESRIDTVCDLLGNQLSLGVAQRLLVSDTDFMVELGRRTRTQALAAFHEAMMPVYENSEKMFKSNQDPKTITAVIGRLHDSLSMFPESNSALPPADLLKFVFRSLLMSSAKNK